MQTISEDGVYDISLEEYHGQCCVGPSISSTGLRTIYLQSPSKYWAHSELNEDGRPQERKEAWDFGRAAHAVILGDEVFSEHYVIRPRKWDSWKRSDAREWREEMWDAGLTVLTEDQMVTIYEMSERLARSPEVVALFKGEVERTMIWQDEKTGVWLKSRPDVLPTMGDIVADLKAVADVSTWAVTRDIRKHGYDMQLGLAKVGLEQTLQRHISSGALCFIEKEYPHDINIVEVEIEEMYWAQIKLRKAINTFHTCLIEDDWPGQTQGIMKYRNPEWHQRELEAMQRSGELPEEY